MEILKAIFETILANLTELATLALAVLTFFYVKATREMVTEMRDTRKPLVSVYFHSIQNFDEIDLDVKNIGGGPTVIKSVELFSKDGLLWKMRSPVIPLGQNESEDTKLFRADKKKYSGHPKKLKFKVAYEDTFGKIVTTEKELNGDELWVSHSWVYVVV